MVGSEGVSDQDLISLYAVYSVMITLQRGHPRRWDEWKARTTWLDGAQIHSASLPDHI